MNNTRSSGHFWTLAIHPRQTIDSLPSTLDILPSTLNPRQKPTFWHGFFVMPIFFVYATAKAQRVSRSVHYANPAGNAFTILWHPQSVGS